MPDSHTYVVGKALPLKNLSLVDPGLTGKGSYKIQAIKKAGIELSWDKKGDHDTYAPGPHRVLC